jgi:hypothetical protein
MDEKKKNSARWGTSMIVLGNLLKEKGEKR